MFGVCEEQMPSSHPADSSALSDRGVKVLLGTSSAQSCDKAVISFHLNLYRGEEEVISA